MAGEGVDLSVDLMPHGTSTPTLLLKTVHFHYPWVLLLVFLVSFVTHSIVNAESSTASIEPTVTGPGGKPLPRRLKKSKEDKEKLKRQDFSHARKLVFMYLSACIILTFIASAANIIVHALSKREEGWWCGEATAVSGKINTNFLWRFCH